MHIYCTKYIYFKDSIWRDKCLYQGFHLLQSPQLPPSTDRCPQLRSGSKHWVPWPSTHTKVHNQWWQMRSIQEQLLCLKGGWSCNLWSIALSLWTRLWLDCLRSFFLFSLPVPIMIYTLPYRMLFWRTTSSADHKLWSPISGSTAKETGLRHQAVGMGQVAAECCETQRVHFSFVSPSEQGANECLQNRSMVHQFWGASMLFYKSFEMNLSQNMLFFAKTSIQPAFYCTSLSNQQILFMVILLKVLTIKTFS